MLNAIRKQASSLAVRVMMVLLVISFALWGIGDVFYSTSDNEVVAVVDELPITATALRRETELRFNQLQQQFGGSLTRDDALMRNLMQQTLQDMVARRLVDAKVREFGLTVSDDTLAGLVRSEPAFQGQGGFDRSRFDLFLRSTGTDEGTFFQQLRADTLRSDLVNAVIGPVAGSQTAADLLTAYRDEQRAGRALVVEAATMSAPEPDEAALEAYLEDHPDRFQLPEYRTIQIATLHPEDLAGEIEVSEEAVRAEYEAQQQRYQTPERRTAVQLLAQDEATADEAAAALRAGKTPEAVVQELGGLTQTPIGPVAEGELPEALDKALFGLGPQKVGDPVETDFGWHVLMITAVEPAHTVPFEEARPELERDMALRRAADELPQIATRMDDTLAGGASVGEAAAQVGAPVREVTLDAQGRTPEGAPVTEPRLASAMLDDIFATPEGQTSLVTPDDRAGYYVFSVEEIQPARTQTLDEARAALVAAWQVDQQAAAAEAEAKALLERARGGETLESLAAEAPGTRLVSLGPIARAAPANAMPLGEAAHAALFATPAGDLAAEVTAVPGGSAVLATDEVIPAPTDRQVADARQELQAGLRNDIAAAFERALRERYTIETRPAALEAAMPQSLR